MKILKLGDVGPEVKELQLLLNSHGFSLKVDGNYGGETKKAIKNFQKERGLVADGVVGNLTFAELEKAHNIEIVHNSEQKIEALDNRTEKYFKTLDPKAQKIFLPFILEAKQIAAEMGFEYIAISGNRGEKEQNDLYAQGRTKPGKIVTNARFGQSNHNAQIALDFGVFKDGDYLDDIKPAQAEKVHEAVAKIASNYGIAWGGVWKFRDIPHFEIKTNLTMAEKMKLIKERGFVL